MYSQQDTVLPGDKLVHSNYLQYLTALTVGLGMDKPITCPPTAPHVVSVDTPTEWVWLLQFTNAVALSGYFNECKVISGSVSKAIVGFKQTSDIKGTKYRPEVHCKWKT